MSRHPVKFPWPYVKDEKKKVIYYHIVSGWPTVMIGPKRVAECFPGYKGHLCSHDKFQELLNEQEKSS
jgi:hypothetical protein